MEKHYKFSGTHLLADFIEVDPTKLIDQQELSNVFLAAIEQAGATILPLAPGKILVNREWVPKIPEIFRTWEVFEPPKSVLSPKHPLYFTSRWISTNILMLDEKRVFVEKDEAPLICAFKNWGFKPIPVPFKHFQTFGGSFHCATLDIRRKGVLKSYV